MVSLLRLEGQLATSTPSKSSAFQPIRWLSLNAIGSAWAIDEPAARQSAFARFSPVRTFAKRRDQLRTLALLLLSVTCVLLAGTLGVTRAFDESIRVWYYHYGSTRDSAQKVVVVGAGPRTALAWPEGAKPEHLEQVITHITSARPNLVVLVDPEKTFGMTQEAVSLLLRDARWSDKVVLARDSLPPQDSVGGIQMLSHDSDAKVWGRPTIFDAVAARTALSQVRETTLPINYLHSRGALPTYPMYALAAGQVLPSGIEGKIVIVGPTGPPFGALVKTPIGEMSPLEVYAQALTAVVDGMVWKQVTLASRIIVLLVALVLWAIWVKGRRRPTSVRTTVLASLLIIVADYLLFSRGLLLWGPAEPLLAIWSAQLIFLRNSLGDLSEKVGALQTRLAEMLPLMGPDNDGGAQNLAEAAFWQDIVDLGRTYVRLDVAALVAELPLGQWHLQMRASSGIALVDVEEKRRDIRRAPFRGPFLTHRAGWVTGFFRDAPEAKTLLVPMQSESRLVGFWLVHVPPEQRTNDQFVRSCEALGRQMAAMIHARRTGAGLTRLDAAGLAEQAVDEMDRDVARVERERTWALELLQQDQEGIVLASLWGPIELINQPMKDHLRAFFPDGVPGEDVRAVLAKLTGGTIDQVQTIMRSAVVDGDEVALPRIQTDTLDIHATMKYTLRRIELGGNAQADEGFPDVARVRLLLRARREKNAENPARAEPLGA